VPRTLYDPKGEKVAGDWRRLLNEELHNVYASPHIIRVIRSRMGWARHVAGMGERTAYKILVGKMKRQLGRLGRRWEDNIKMNLG
jgi:alcohol dehydrogenase class IV